MKKRFLSYIRSNIKKQYPKYSEDKLDEIMYGVEGIYLTITKSIIILALSLILGIFKELIYLLVAFNFIRLFAFGMHANNSLTCLIFSSFVFLSGAALCKYVVLSKELIYALYLIVLIIIAIYSPADTIKRPLIKKKKRIRFKILSILTVIIYFVTSLFIKDNLIINSLIFGLIVECILILPITYKVFKLPYKNYVKYGLSA